MNTTQLSDAEIEQVRATCQANVEQTGKPRYKVVGRAFGIPPTKVEYYFRFWKQPASKPKLANDVLRVHIDRDLKQRVVQLLQPYGITPSAACRTLMERLAAGSVAPSWLSPDISTTPDPQPAFSTYPNTILADFLAEGIGDELTREIAEARAASPELRPYTA